MPAPPRRSLAALRPGPTDRAVFVGMTGSGKTTLAEMLLRYRPYVVVLDVKGTLDWRGYELHRTLDKLTQSKAPRLIYRPGHVELADSQALDDFFAWVYDRGNTTLYVDELHGVGTATKYPHYLGACLQRGREKGVCLWASTQRPVKIPSIVLSESEHVYCFRLKLAQDRDRIEEVTGVPADVLATLPKYDFWYAPQVEQPRGPLRVRMFPTSRKVLPVWPTS